MRRAAVILGLVACGGSRDAGPSGKVELIPAPPAGEVAPWVVERVAAARGRDVVVYVGATWCEPCGYFHRAVVDGQLDAGFPRLTLLEFDADVDEARLRAAGYTSQMIPLFVRPGPDGRATDRTMEGSIKGDGAVAELTPRLRALLAK